MLRYGRAHQSAGFLLCCDYLVNSEMDNDHQLVRKLVTTAIPDDGMTFLL